MSRPPHSPLFDLPNNIWGGVQNMKLLIVQLSAFSCYFIPLLVQIFFSEPSSQTPSPSSLSVRDQVSHPYKTTGRIMVLYILTFTFLGSRRDDKRLWTEW
jgi:hypothetical protein